MTAVDERPERPLAKVPSGAWGYLRATGPGLLVAMAWLSAGDLVSSSVSGSTYGYALMWAFVLSLFARYFFVSAIGKYVLCNNDDNDSIMMGFRRLWSGLPLIVSVTAFILGFTYQTYIIKGAATAVYNLTGRVGGSDWVIFLIAVLLVGLTISMLFAGRQYRTLETIARVSVLALIVTFVVAAAVRGFDPLELARGMTFRLPSDTGPFGAVVLTAAIIGAVGGSAANLLYPYFIRDKGWRGPAYRKLQILDLLTGILAMIVINLAIWVVAAETLLGSGVAIEGPENLTTMMTRAVGTFGPLLLWIGVFFVTFNSFPAFSYGFTKILLDGVQNAFSRPNRRPEELEKHRAFRWIQVGILLILPLPFSLPMAPDFVALAIAGNALGAITGPIIILGVIILTTRRKFMLQEYVNKWWETLALLVIGGIGLWATYGVVAGLLS